MTKEEFTLNNQSKYFSLEMLEEFVKICCPGILDISEEIKKGKLSSFSNFSNKKENMDLNSAHNPIQHTTIEENR